LTEDANPRTRGAMGGTAAGRLATWPAAGTVLTVSSRALVAACERLGVDTAALLAAAGVSRAVLDDPDERLPAQQVTVLWRTAYELSNDPVLSLHAAEACPLGAYKVIDYMAYNAHSVGEAFRYGARYFKLINTAITLPIDASGDPISFGIVEDDNPAGVSRPYAEYCFAAFLLHVRAGTGAAFTPARVQFTHQRPADIAEHERVFGCPVEFEARHTRMLIARRAWELPSTRAQAGVLELLAEHADHLLAKLPQRPALVERARKAISARLRGGDPSLEGVARDLGTSARSLQRHLADLGFSFQTVADEVRQTTAGLYLEQPDIAISEVAYLLGFSDPSAFNRAFKRWTGMTPQQYRRSTPLPQR
jgi:AraC-like DNA-binding protein